MSKNARLLLIEDHRDIAEMVIAYLEGKGFICDYASNGVMGLNIAVEMAAEIDLIILDLNLPGMDGIDVCRSLREQAKVKTPIIMLTARDTLEDKVAGLNTGADDYLVKPFAMLELEARIRAQLRRDQDDIVRSAIAIGDLRLDRATMEVYRAGDTIRLSPIGFRILELLMRASPAVVSRSELEREIWGEDLPDSDTLRSHIYALRKKVDKPYDMAYIHSVSGSGYQLKPEVA